MKKSKLSLCLTSGFAAAMALAACSNAVTAKTGVVLTVKDANGNVQDVTADAIYDKSRTDTEGTTKFYNAVLEALIRYEYQNTNESIKNWKKSIKTYSKIKEEAEDKVKNDKETAKTNASTNGTSYETEWEKILTSHNCLPGENDSESGEQKLLQYYIYQLEKEDINDKFFIEQKEDLTKEWLGITKDGVAASQDVKGVFPYHIRHVLVKLASGSTNFYDGTITEDEAKKLGNVMESLIDSNYTFAQVAQQYSDDNDGDDPSSEKGGDLGVMTTSTPFVNEFKLGIYAFDAIYGKEDNSEATQVIRKGLGLNDDYTFSLRNTTDKDSVPEPTSAYGAFKNKINDGRLQEVPYDAFLKLKEYFDVTTDENGKAVNDGNEHYYPRNVLYNYYLNFHNPFVITRQLVDTANGSGLPVADTSGLYGARFTEMNVNGVNKDVLCDGDGHVIIGVRSSHGIHFMIIEHSIFQYAEGGAGSALSSLEEYYTTLVPSDPDFPNIGDKDKTHKETYVEFISTSEATTYTTRSNEIAQSLKSFDSAYEYRLFKYLLGIEQGKVSINNTDLSPIKDKIEEKIALARQSAYETKDRTLNEAWRTYAELIALQYENRTEWGNVETTSETLRIIHPRCAIGFKNHTGDAWDKDLGGVCYYAK